MSFNAIFNGTPSNVPSPSGQVADGIDTSTNAEWTSGANGWVPVSPAFAKAVLLNQTAASQANLLTVVAPVTGLYRVSAYTVQANSTSGTLPSVTATFTEGDTGTTSCTAQVKATTSTTGEGQSGSGSAVINAQAGSNIVVSSASAATTTYNIKTRIEYIG